VAELMIKGSKD